MTKTARAWTRMWIVLLLLAGLMAFGPRGAVHATDRTVTTTADGGLGSLRAAIAASHSVTVTLTVEPNRVYLPLGLRNN